MIYILKTFSKINPGKKNKFFTKINIPIKRFRSGFITYKKEEMFYTNDAVKTGSSSRAQ